MYNEEENAVDDEFEMGEDAEMDGGGLEPDEEDSYDPDDRYH